MNLEGRTQLQRASQGVREPNDRKLKQAQPLSGSIYEPNLPLRKTQCSPLHGGRMSYVIEPIGKGFVVFGEDEQKIFSVRCFVYE